MKNRKTKRKKVKCIKTRKNRRFALGGQQPQPMPAPPQVPDEYERRCSRLDTLLPNKQNYIWKKCIKMTDGPLYVLYITPNNIFGRTIETLIIPEFLCSVNGQIARRKIMIEDKYVARFVMIDGRWYAIMRLFGKTHNSGILADVEYYKAFYLLGKGFEVDNNTGIIILSPEHIRFKTTWVILSTSSAPIVELVGGNDVYLPLVSSTVVDGYYNFDVLQSIRIDEIIRSASKLVHLNRPLNRL